MLQLSAPEGIYEELWTNQTVTVPSGEEVQLEAKDGIVLLWSKE